MVLYNSTDYIGKLIQYTSNNITGSEGLSLFLIVLTIIGIMAVFKFPIDYYPVMLLPLFIVLALYNSFFMVFLALDILLLAFVFVSIF